MLCHRDVYIYPMKTRVRQLLPWCLAAVVSVVCQAYMLAGQEAMSEAVDVELFASAWSQSGHLHTAAVFAERLVDLLHAAY